MMIQPRGYVQTESKDSSYVQGYWGISGKSIGSWRIQEQVTLANNGHFMMRLIF